MADDNTPAPAAATASRPRRQAAKAAPAVATEAPRPAQRKIAGNLPYTLSPGVLKRVMDKIPSADKPPVFNVDFLGAVMGATGGSARPIIPILKNTLMLNQSGAPTELYAQFQTDGGRASAALQAMRNGFAEVFRRNTYAHQISEPDLVDIIVAITGLTKSDRILKAMVSTFQTFQGFARSAKADAPQVEPLEGTTPEFEGQPSDSGGRSKQLQLVYNINVVLPETTNVEVFNAIFKSLKGNLLN